MKSILSFIIVATFISNGLAQEIKADSLIAKKSPKSVLYVAVGVVFPEGRLSVSDERSFSSGYAQIGLTTHIKYRYFLGKSLFLTSTLQYQLNDSDNSLDQKDGLSEFSLSRERSSTNWKTYTGFIGAGLRSRITKKFYFTNHFLAGHSLTKSPFYKETEVQTSQTLIHKKYSANSSGMAYQLGIGLSFEPNEKLSFLIVADYFRSNVKFKNVKNTTEILVNSGQNYIQSYESSDFKNTTIVLINLSVGIGFKF